jgi:hypothetical protein
LRQFQSVEDAARGVAALRLGIPPFVTPPSRVGLLPDGAFAPFITGSIFQKPTSPQ